jgi:excisionase family DNA binding protein
LLAIFNEEQRGMENTAFTSDLITAPIGEFCRLSGIGRSKVYEMLGSGEIESIHVGTRRLVLLDSYRRLIERQRAAQAERRARPADATPDAKIAKPVHRGAATP